MQLLLSVIGFMVDDTLLYKYSTFYHKTNDSPTKRQFQYKYSYSNTSIENNNFKNCYPLM